MIRGRFDFTLLSSDKKCVNLLGTIMNTKDAFKVTVKAQKMLNFGYLLYLLISYSK